MVLHQLFCLFGERSTCISQNQLDGVACNQVFELPKSKIIVCSFVMHSSCAFRTFSCTGANRKCTTTKLTAGLPFINGSCVITSLSCGVNSLLHYKVVWNRSMHFQCAFNSVCLQCTLKHCQTVFSVKAPLDWHRIQLLCIAYHARTISNENLPK